MKKRILLSILAFAAAALASSAQITVSWGNDAEVVKLASSSGSLLPVGSELLLGSFAAGTDFSNTSYTYMSSQFTQYGVSAVGDGGYGVPGLFVASATASAPTSTKLYIWSFNASTAASATQWGIFSTSGTTWTTASSAPDVLAVDISQATTADFGSLSASLAMTSAVPEPSTYAAILGFVTLGLVGYRRFRRR